MKIQSGIVLLLLALGSPALAESSEKGSLDVLKGQFGFNWFNNPSKEKCVRVDDKLLKDFQKNYTCNLQEDTGSSSGKPQVRCTRKDEKREYLVFKTKAFCEEERAAQMANAE